VPLSATGPDQLQAVTAGPNGTFYAAGYSATSPSAAKMLTLVKLTATGIDTSFGSSEGVISPGVEFRGGSDEIDVATQPSGKIIISATVASTSNPDDRDVALIRLNADGALDSTFGTYGVKKVDLSTAHNDGMKLVGLDAARALAIGADGAIYLHAIQRGEGTALSGGPRTDTDFTVVKLTAEGEVDTTYGTNGKVLVDIQESNATPRGLTVLSDGSVIASGYANSPDLGTVQPVLYRLTPQGALDTKFGNKGVFHETVLAVQTEIYGFVVHGENLVTAGYGRASGDTNDWVSMQFDITSGVRNKNWGGAANGALMIDPSGASLGSNCRNAVGLPDSKTVLIGSTGPSNQPAQDAAFAVLDANGNLDPAYGDGVHTFALGSNGNDAFWGGAVSGDTLLLVGFKGGGATQTEAQNDDAFAVAVPVR
jgi:uncharacterized delta-60 repeat protein